MFSRAQILALVIGFCVGIFCISVILLFSIKSEVVVAPKGRICIIIDDFGNALNETAAGFFNLDTSLTFSILPGRPFTKETGIFLDSLDLETIVHMPMEPFNAYDTVQVADEYLMLYARLNADEVRERVSEAFREIPSAVGMNNHMGSAATEDLQLMKNLARTLKESGKYFIDSFTSPESRAFLTMRRYGVKTELRQVFLDHVDDRVFIKAQLDSLVMLSHDMEIAIGIGHVKPATLAVLQVAIPRLRAEGYVFFRASEIVR